MKYHSPKYCIIINGVTSLMNWKTTNFAMVAQSVQSRMAVNLTTFGH